MGKLTNIQHLRALAAIAVMLGHLANRMEWDPSWLPGLKAGFGVDLFFVISGFIMYYTTRDDWGTKGAPREFITRRLIRIVPIYWILSILWGVFQIVTHLDEPAKQPSLLDWVRTFTFLPIVDADGLIWPIILNGWTLDFEMFFYVLFAFALIFARRRGLIFLGLLFAACIVAGNWIPERSVAYAFTRPLILEFLIGVLLGAWFVHARGGLGDLRLPFLPIAVGFFVVHAVLFSRPNDERVEFEYFYVWAFAALIVFVALAARQSHDRTVAGRAMTAIGDSSYSLYLSHPISMGLFAMAAEKSRLAALLPSWAYALLAIATALGASWLIYIAIERPLTRRLSRRFVKRRSTATGELSRAASKA